LKIFKIFFFKKKKKKQKKKNKKKKQKHKTKKKKQHKKKKTTKKIKKKKKTFFFLKRAAFFLFSYLWLDKMLITIQLIISGFMLSANERIIITTNLPQWAWSWHCLCYYVHTI